MTQRDVDVNTSVFRLLFLLVY